MFVDFFIHRPIFATVCALLIILAGAVTIPTLPVAQFPSLAPPQVTVASYYNGANAQAVETSVTTPIEQQINGVEGMKYMSSISTNSGVSNITVTFDVSRNIDLAAVDVQNRVNAALGRLPGEVRTTGVNVTKGLSGFVFGAGVYTEHGEFDSLFLSNYMDVYVRDSIKRVPGVAEVVIFGERKYSMRLWLDPVRLAGRGLTATDVLSALQEQNVQVAAGGVGQPPSRTGQAYQISVRAVGRMVEPAEFENIILKTGADGTLVRVRDVGRAELGAESYNSNLRFNGHDAVGFAVVQLPSANSLSVYRDAKAELDRLALRFPPGMKYAVAFDTTTVVSESIRDVLVTLLEAIALVVLVLFVFLQNWRSTLIPAVTIPVSLIGTFAFVKLLDFSINTLTLFGLTLATGLVVDDAIVVIENVQRHISEGIHDTHRAASVAMKEVAGAVVATSLVLIAVFVPVAFFPGTTGILFRQFALTIAFSVAISTFNAVTLSPALSALFLGRGQTSSRWFGPFNRGLAAFSKAYQSSMRFSLRHKAAMVVLFAAGLALTYWIYLRVPRAFIPAEDAGYFIIAVQSPAGASLEYTTDICRQAEQALSGIPEVSGIFSVVGFGAGGTAPNRAVIYVPLKPFAERPGEEHSAATVINRVRPSLLAISGATVIPFPPPAIQGLGQFGGFSFIVQDLAGDSPQALAAATQAMAQAGNRSPDLRGLFSGFTSSDPQYVVTFNREKAKALQVPLYQITAALQVYMGSVYVNDFDFNNRSYRVYVQADQQFRSESKDIRQYYVRSDQGTMIPLESLVEIEQAASPQIINHYNLYRSAQIDGSAAPGRSSGEAIAAMQALAQRTLPAGFGYEWTGLSREEIESGGQVVIFFTLGLIVVYLTLAAQFESFSLPFIILLAVPLALLGAISAQALRGHQNDVYCQIGMVMLIGLACKNSILIVEFAEQLRERGLSIADAAVEAARIRLRPILMTSLTLILGVLPLVLAQGAGRISRRSVGTTVFGGMIAATFLNMVFIPVLYVLVKLFQERWRKHPAAAAAEPLASQD
jgi:HAE1 family hydrophobic/amphiphilic exporter-1